MNVLLTYQPNNDHYSTAITRKFMDEKAYKDWLLEIKNKVRQAQLKAVANFNIALIELYWELGKEIVLRQTESKWVDNFLEQLSIDLKRVSRK